MDRFHGELALRCRYATPPPPVAPLAGSLSRALRKCWILKQTAVASCLGRVADQVEMMLISWFGF